MTTHCLVILLCVSTLRKSVFDSLKKSLPLSKQNKITNGKKCDWRCDWNVTVYLIKGLVLRVLDGGVLCSKPLSRSEIRSAFHPSVANQISIKKPWKLSGLNRDCPSQHHGSLDAVEPFVNFWFNQLLSTNGTWRRTLLRLYSKWNLQLMHLPCVPFTSIIRTG